LPRVSARRRPRRLDASSRCSYGHGMPGPARVVCISHEAGTGGEEVGRLVAERLGFTLVDEEIVALAAERADVSPADIADAERRKTVVARVLDMLGRGLAADAVAGLSPAGSVGDAEAPYRALIADVVAETANRGDVVIVSHGASVALAGRADILRALVVGSVGARAERLAAGEDREAGTRAVKAEDAARADYLRRF